MSDNRLPNAGGLELTAGWSKSEILALVVDETVHGAPGRTGFVATGQTTAAGQTGRIWTDAPRRAPIGAGELVEVCAHAAAFLAGAPVAPGVRAIFYNAAGNQAGAFDLAVSPPQNATHGVAVAGLTATFQRAWGRVTAPAGSVSMGLEISRTGGGAGQTMKLVLLKPLMATVPAGRAEPLPWSPGVHVEADLQRPAWPAILRPFRADTGADPLSALVEFQGESGRPKARVIARDPARRFSGRMRCDPVQRAALETFWRGLDGDFWFVEPDSERLCVASRAGDGAPRMVESLGPTVFMEVGLWLETA